ncbi:MAG TPA: prepilin-type N-terminal cleavage/methylation domain-containing protein [Nitrospirae bacterium]|nr:prepilin-type N-terminal cleavage/methylation domain-containing protein [Nitrospirota bacterium]
MNKRGFTLIELLIALSALSIVMLVLFTSLSSSIKTIEAVDDSISIIQEARTFIDILTREIESAIYTPNSENSFFKFTERDYFGMPVSEIHFVSIATFSRGVYVIAYKTEIEQEVFKIYKKIYPPTTNSEEAKWEEVISNVYGFSFTTYNSKGELVKNWDSTISQSIPNEIKIELYIKTNKDKEPFKISEIAKTRINKTLGSF